MSKKLIAAALAGVMMTGSLAAVPALAQAPAAAAKVTSKSPLKAFIADKKAMEVLAKYAPQVAEFLASGAGEGMLPEGSTIASLSEIEQAQGAGLTPDAVKKIDEDLAK